MTDWWKEHQRIVDAIIDKNKEEAVRLIQEHIYIQELTVIKKLQRAGSIKKQHLQRIKILQQTMVCLRYLYFFQEALECTIRLKQSWKQISVI